MKILFTVQGEGRGHMTQAIALNEILRRHGHQVVGVIVGKNPSRSLPGFFEKAFDVPITPIVSPGFNFKGGRGVSVVGTGMELLKNLPRYRQSLRTIDRMISDTRPDVVLNFLEPLVGVYNLLHRHSVPVLVVGHQFMMEHPDYIKVKKFFWQQVGMRQYVSLTGIRSTRLALSFYQAKDFPDRKLFVIPPILRQQLFDLTPSPNGKFLLVYLVNHGYSEEIIGWHKANPEVEIHCFYDKPGAEPEHRFDSKLTFHQLNGEKFLRMMADCRAVVCTAGFESVSEAAYLGKPVLMVPVENHVEQYINAIDAEKTGIGISDTRFNISRLFDPAMESKTNSFRQWVDQAESAFLRVLEQMASRKLPHGMKGRLHEFAEDQSRNR